MVTKKLLLVFKISLVTASILMAVLAAAGVYSAVLMLTGGEMDREEDDSPLFITFPEDSDITTSLVDDNMRISAPMGFKNNGFMPIEDLVLNLSVAYRGSNLLHGHNVIGTIPGGESKEQTITFSGSLGGLVDMGLGEALYNDVKTKMVIGVAASYVYGLVSFSLELSFDHQWDAPVNISADMNNMQIVLNNDATATMTIPVIINTAEWISGTVETELNISSPLSPLPVGHVQFSAELGGEIVENATITMPITDLNRMSTHGTYLQLHGDVELAVGSKSIVYFLSKTIIWRASLREVEVNIYRSGGEIELDIHFTNAREEGRGFVLSVYLYTGSTLVANIEERPFLESGQPHFYMDTAWGASSADTYVCTIGWEGSGPIYAEGGAI